jgi:hypothetical protein
MSNTLTEIAESVIRTFRITVGEGKHKEAA